MFQCNCSILFDDVSKKALVIDPGDECALIQDQISALGLEVEAIWHTHAHIDHIGATKELLHYLTAEYQVKGLSIPKVYLHEGDRWLYENINVQAQMLGLSALEVPPEFEAIKEGKWSVGSTNLRSIHTPGHTPGSCCLYLQQEVAFEGPRAIFGNTHSSKKVLLSGDTLFKRSIGRTDLWGGDSQLILKSIKNKLLNLDPETLVIPGHGPVTSILEEAEKNPFLQ